MLLQVNGLLVVLLWGNLLKQSVLSYNPLLTAGIAGSF